MGWIQTEVNNLYKKYNTRNPFELAKCLGVHIKHWDLHGDVKGFYLFHKRNRFIFLNNDLDEKEKIFVCAHELGHAVLHKHSSTPFMRTNTLFSIDKLEREANTFAAELLIPDDAIYCREQPTIFDIAAHYEIPEDLVKLKFK